MKKAKNSILHIFILHMEICQLMEKFDYKYNLNDINNKLFRLHESKIGLIHMYLKKNPIRI